MYHHEHILCYSGGCYYPDTHHDCSFVHAICNKLEIFWIFENVKIKIFLKSCVVWRMGWYLSLQGSLSPTSDCVLYIYTIRYYITSIEKFHICSSLHNRNSYNPIMVDYMFNLYCTCTYVCTFRKTNKPNKQMS